MRSSASSAALLAALGAAEVLATAVSPIERVLEMMESMLEKGKEEKHQETVQFTTYKEFCDNTRVNKEQAIKESTQQIEILTADITKFETDAEHLTREIAAHDVDIDIWEGDEKAATKVRAIEKADYDVLHADYTESIKALEAAIKVLSMPRNKKQAPLAFAQLRKCSLIPREAKDAIDLYMRQDPEVSESMSISDSDEASLLQQEPNAYEKVSGKVVEMLEQLLAKFQDERLALEKEELNSKHAFETLIQELADQLKEGGADREWKQDMKAKRLQEKADAQQDMSESQTSLADDQSYLEDMNSNCHAKAADYEQRQVLRAEEIKVIEKAISIVGSDEVAGSAEKHLPSLLQSKAAGKSLAQLRAKRFATPMQEKAARFLQNKASETQSRILKAVVSHLATDPLAKVKKLIWDLINRLSEEANEEASHKGWCDTEMGVNSQVRHEKSDAVEMLRAEIDELGASITKVAEDIKGLSEAVVQLDEAMVTATKIRDEEKSKNQATMADATAGEAAVEQALRVLKDFYAKADGATALLQQKRQEPPETFDKPYQGMSGGGIIGMLEVIESDFARLSAETDGAEDAAQAQYDQFMQDSKVDKTEKSTTMDHKTAKKQTEEHTLVSKKKDLVGTERELDAALKYYDKLKPSCVGAQETYADRVAAREAEIQSLKDALQILENQS